MNVQMTITLLLAIVFSVPCCAQTEDEIVEDSEFISTYPLKSCRPYYPDYYEFNSPSPTFEFKYYEKDPTYIHFYETGPGYTKIQSFPIAFVEFISMENNEIRLIWFSAPHHTDDRTGVTCKFWSRIVARDFYKTITRDRQSELVHIMKADYLKKSESDNSDTVLAKQLDLYFDGFERNITIVVKNDEGDPVAIIPKDAINETIECESAEIAMYVESTRGGELRYKFGFSTASQASAWNELLNRLRKLIGAGNSKHPFYRRPNRNPAIDEFLTLIADEIRIRRLVL